MKIHQLPDGARFEYEGEEYVKTAPMCGTGKGGQRLIPKYAQLTPLDAVGSTQGPRKGDGLSRAKVLKAFAAYDVECKALLPDEQQAAFDEARARFLKALE